MQLGRRVNDALTRLDKPESKFSDVSLSALLRKSLFGNTYLQHGLNC